MNLIELRVRHLPFSYAVGEGPTSELAISSTFLLAGEPLPSARKMNGKHIDNIKRPRMHMIGNSWEHALYSDARIELNESCSRFQAFAAQASTIFTTTGLLRSCLLPIQEKKTPSIVSMIIIIV